MAKPKPRQQGVVSRATREALHRWSSAQRKQDASTPADYLLKLCHVDYAHFVAAVKANDKDVAKRRANLLESANAAAPYWNSKAPSLQKISGDAANPLESQVVVKVVRFGDETNPNAAPVPAYTLEGQSTAVPHTGNGRAT